MIQDIKNTLFHFKNSKIVRSLKPLLSKKIKHKSPIKKGRAFTLIELLIVIGILIILTAITVPLFRSFQKESDLKNTTQEIINVLRLAQSQTLASRRDKSWGVWFSTSTIPQQYTLFEGQNYSLRITSSDETYKLPNTVEAYEISLTGDSPEVIFNQIVGTTDQPGSISLRLKDDILKTRQVIVKSSGKIISEAEADPSDENRAKDSRHIHFDYSRQIATSSEILELTFTYNGSSQTENIVIADSLKDGQIYWKGKVEVDGENQELKIHTHRLNDLLLGTQFCIHRDKRYNTKALKMEISGDSGGDLIKYTADGQTTQGTSIYALLPLWQ